MTDKDHSKIYDAYRVEKQDEQVSSQNNENIDLTKILKDCPKGTKFYSYIFGDETYFQGFSLYKGKPMSITIYGKKGEWQNFSLSRKGHPYNDECGECCIFPSREMRDWSKFSAPWYQNEKIEKFNPKTLVPFDRVLVRDKYTNWSCDFFSHIEDANFQYYVITGGYKLCIPYNDKTKHLVGTKDEAPEYYRYWDD